MVLPCIVNLFNKSITLENLTILRIVSILGVYVSYSEKLCMSLI
jgi:hypothetical protein